MRNKIGLALVSIALVFPKLGNYVEAEEQNNTVKEQDSLQDEMIPNDENVIIIPEEDPITEEKALSDMTVEEGSSDLDLADKIISGEIENSTEENKDLKELERETIELSEEEVDSESAEKSLVEDQGETVSEKSLPITHSANKVVIQGDTTYFLNNSGFIEYSETYSEGVLVKIQEYYAQTLLENADKNVQYIFNLNGKENLLNAKKLDKDTQRIITQYEYYPQTVYGHNHGSSIRYKFDISASGYLTKASKREKGTQRILSWYEYYPQTVYGQSHGSNIMYKFDINSKGHLTKASKREKGTQRILSWYEYYPQTVYGKDHGKNLMYRFDFHNNGNLAKASKREKGTQRILNWYEYYPQTIYGKDHGNNLMYRFDFQANGDLAKASKREKGTQKILNWYEYYPHTIYGKDHGKNLMYRFDFRANGDLAKASKRENITQRIISWYEYYPGTTYGENHGKNILYKLDINSKGYVTSSNKREQGSQQILVWYQYAPNTVYGTHGSQIIGRKLNVPLVSQLPELPTGCEITAVTMMLQYKGVKADKVKLAKEMPKHSWDPNYGYVGDPFTKNGWTIYPSALTGLIDRYAGDAVNLTGKSNTSIENQLSLNKPVVVWVSPMHGFSVHALVLTGFDQNNYFYNDPWTGEKEVKISKSSFNTIWNAQSKRAISY